MSDSLLIVNQTVMRLATVLTELSVRTGNPDLADQIREQLDRNIETLSLEIAVSHPSGRLPNDDS